jgi:hypothetical protein
VPDERCQIPRIPRTLSGKKIEVSIRRILLGMPVADWADPDAVASTDLLAYFRLRRRHRTTSLTAGPLALQQRRQWIQRD